MPGGPASGSDTPVEALGLSAHVCQSLRKAGIDTVSRLLALSTKELEGIPGIGISTRAAIRYSLNRYLAAPTTLRAKAQATAPGSAAPPVGQVAPAPERAAEASPSIDLLGLSVRAYNCLRRNGVTTIAQLAALSDEQLLEMRNFGVNSLAEIRQKLAKYLGDHPEDERRQAEAAPVEPAEPVVEPEETGPAPDVAVEDRTAITALGLSVRAYHCLSNAGARTVGQVAAMTDGQLLSIRNLGQTTLSEIKHKLATYLATPPERRPVPYLPGTEFPSEPEAEAETSLDQIVTGWLGILRPQQREVLGLRLGWSGPRLTLEQIGQQMGLTRQRVLQIQTRAMERLASPKGWNLIKARMEPLVERFEGTGGLMTEAEACKALLNLVSPGDQDPSAALRLLLLGCGRFQEIWDQVWGLVSKPLALVQPVYDELVELLRQMGGQAMVEELLSRFAATALGREHRKELDAAFLAAILRVGQQTELDGEKVCLLSRPDAGEAGLAEPASAPTTLVEWERRLRRLVGRVELLGEIPITDEERKEVGRLIGLRLRDLKRSEALRAFRHTYPCSMAVFLVAQGVYGYGGSEGYWPGVSEAIGKDLDAVWTLRLGRLFEDVLRDLGLPLFPDLGGRRYVDLILVHGGIPDYCLPDFFGKLLQPGVTRPQYAGMSATELISEWLWRASGRYGTDRPVLHFLEFGGSVARDFVERCLEMAREYGQSGLVPEAVEVGLPARVVDAYRQWSSEQDASQMRREAGGRWGLRRPDLVVDPWGEGVLFDLPPQQVPATEIQTDIAWQVTAGDEVYTIPVRVRRTGFDWKTSAEKLSMGQPAAEFEVTLLAEGQAKRTWRFAGVDADRPLLVFDPDRGTILSWQHSLPARRLGLLYPKECALHIRGGGQLLEDLPRLPWGWSSFRGQTWELQDADGLELLRDGDSILEAALRPDESMLRPYLVGGRVVSAGESGSRAPVYEGPPPTIRIPITGRQALEEELARWRLTVHNRWAARPEVALTTTLDSLRAELIVSNRHADLPLHLPSLLGTDPVGSFTVGLRGPLGRDAEFTLRLVPQLRISGHDRLYLPDAQTGPQPVMLYVETLPEYRVESQGEGDGCHLISSEVRANLRQTQLQVDPETASVELTVIHPLPSGDVVRVPVLVPIRHLRWTLVEDKAGAGRREWTGRAVKRPVDALLQVESPCLLVELPRSEGDAPSLRLTLLDVDSATLQQTNWLEAAPGQRLWRFELGSFFDTIRKATASPILRFELEGYRLPAAEGAQHWPVLSLTRTLLVEDVHLTSQSLHSRRVLELHWRETRPLKNRHVRFWPLWRPWDGLFEQAIPDTAAGVWTFEAPRGELRSNKVRLEFVVVDPWVPQVPQKPPKDTPGTAEVELISPDKQLQQLDAQLDDKGPTFELLLERAVVCHDKGDPEKARSDCQWCYEHLDEGTVPQILCLVELVQESGDAATLRALQLKMFSSRRLGLVLQARQRGEVSRECLEAYLGYLPRSALLPQSTCIQLLSVEHEAVRLHALQQLIRRGAVEGVETILQWVEAATLSDADAVAILSLNAGFAVECLRDHSDAPGPQRLLTALGQAAEGVVRVGQWLRSNLGWGRVERIEHLNTGRQVQWCVARESHYRLHVILRPDEHPEAVVVDLRSSTAVFAGHGPARICAECGQFTTQIGDVLSRHFLVAHRPRGYWERRYRRDGYAKFRVEDGPVAITALELAVGKPAKQMV